MIGKNREDERLGIQKSDLWPSYEQLNVDLMQFIQKLRTHYKIATICNGGSREAVNRKFMLDKLIDLMLFDSEEGLSKPDALIYHRALMRLGLQPNEVVFVDDKERNVEVAHQLGMFTVHFENTIQAIADLEVLLKDTST